MEPINFVFFNTKNLLKLCLQGCDTLWLSVNITETILYYNYAVSICYRYY